MTEEVITEVQPEVKVEPQKEFRNDQGFTKTEWDSINWDYGDKCLPRYMSMGLWNPRALRGGKYSKSQRRSFAKASKMGHKK